MKKNTKTNKSKPLASPLTDKQSGQDSQKSKGISDFTFSVVISVIYLILSIYGILQHEAWRDEFQALQIAQNSTSLSDLFHNIRHEGHPAMWHILLYIISSFSTSLTAMKMLHVFLAASGVFIFNRFAPFPRIAKILFTFGYFIFYEYMMISRPYVGGVLFLFLFCALYGMYIQNRKAVFLLLMGVALFFLSNTSIFGVMLSLCLLFFLSLDVWFGNLKNILKKENHKPALALLALTLGGIIIAILQIRPPADNNFPIQYASGYDIIRLKYALTKIWITYFPIPELGKINAWNSSIFIKGQEEYTIFPSLLLLAISSIFFWRKRQILWVYILGTFGLLAFSYYTIQAGARYSGHLYLLLIACFWLYQLALSIPPTAVLGKKTIAKTGKPGLFLGRMYLYIILTAHLFAGVYMYITDVRAPFSNMEKMGKHLLENKLDTLQIAGTTDYLASPASFYTRKPIYFPERKSEEYFIKWDKKRLNGKLAIPDVFSQLSSMVSKNNKPILLILSPELQIVKDGEPASFEEGDIAEGVKMKSIAKFDKECMEETEKYFLYMIESKK